MSTIFHSPGFKRSLKILSWIPVIIAFNDNVSYIARIKGPSMRPSLNPNDNELSTDWVLLWKWGCTQSYNLKRNDIVLIKSPSDPHKIYCKRIKGVQFDTIKTLHPYPKETVLVPRNHIWVEGDNVTQSVDSNNFGAVATGMIVGKVVKVIWPPTRWGTNLNETVGRHDALSLATRQ
ncbi:hypothetical protein TPHA_0C02600 [Tetrapisispora phaffii CBS 4417]|uniref:Mitochondrial inner membrane protease subunit 2 n=1 Tax=Tetrapisispora phaffii (strain ATCC 24235 / CBS 4417 / NBRC 1672 / NRRL Y-8282 / UCD 70-5) TaxID=1071381 RepID=G8BRN7_TETPH|nr:hypothetical protein TPHA_0C02600 [Tetrapisispora phaffii CBS 4417]CCE62413.1 hypothetical protein TPHA_0C02600 [Tetrapisispora phaffii CBS 4417]